MLKKTLHFALVVIIALGLSVSVQSLLAAWTAPTQTAPNCASGTPGCDAPINTSAAGQVKSGDFDTLGALSALGNLTAGGNVLVSGSTLTAAQTTNPHFYFNSYDGIQLRLDSNNNSANSEFQINNGANNSVFYVNENGNVGIGTTAPAYKLTIVGTSTVLGLDNGALISAKNTAGAYQGFLWPRWTDNATYMNYGQGGFFIRNVNASTMMYMTNTGNVGVGTTSPMEKLHVGAGNIAFDNGYGIRGRDTAGNPQTLLAITSANNVQLVTPTIGGNLQFNVNNGSGLMQFLTNATEKMRLTSAGDVGIGTTTPRGKLHVADTNAELEIESTHATNPWVNLNFTHKGTVVNQIQAHGTEVGSLFFTTKDPGTILLTERMRIKNNGNVGIGTIAPNARLQIDAPASTEGLRIISASDWSPLNIRNSADTADIFRVDQSGTLATGTIPWARLASFPAACPLNQYVTAIGGTLTCAPAGGVTGSGTANYISKWTSGSALGNSLIYDNGTNVGIGTSSPSQKLDVNGIIRSSLGSGYGALELVPGAGTGYRMTLNNDNTLLLQSSTDKFSSASNVMTLSNSNVGIGTTNPGAKLEVNGNVQTTSTNSWSKAGYAVAYSYATTGNVGFGGNLFQDTDGAWKYHNTVGWGGKGLAWNFFPSDRAELLYASNGVNPATPSALMTVKTATGNVGIGTTNPTNKLSVVAPDNDGLYITPLNVNDQPRVHFSTSHGVGGMIQKYNPNVLDVYGGANTPLTLSANGTEKVRITTAGNVGVGTTVPGAKMQINPPISTEGLRIVSASDWSPLNIRNSGDTADIFRVDQTGSLAVGSIPWNKITNFPAACPANQYVTAVGGTLTCAAVTGTVTGSGTANYMPKWTSGSALGNSLVYDDGTNVGIGTASPAERLEVSVNSTTTDTWPLIVRNSRNNGTMDYDNGIKIKFSNDSTANEQNKWVGIKGVLEGAWANQIGMAFYTQPTGATPPVESMRIRNNGNVGIGTTSPAQKLDVSGTIAVRDGNSYGSISYNTANKALNLVTPNPGSGGSNINLQVGGWSNDYVDINNGGGSSYHRLVANGNSYFAAVGGNVGIGNTAPGAKLQVNPPTGVEGMRIVSASNWSPLNIRNSTDTADIFRVDQSGTLATGTIPWGRLSAFPGACPANQYVTAIGGTLTCSAVTGAVSGSGTANYLTKWTSGSAAGNSIIYDNGTNVGIGTVNPSHALTVVGDDKGVSVAQSSYNYGGNPIGAILGSWGSAYTNAAGIKFHRWLGTATDYSTLYVGQANDGSGNFDFVVKSDVRGTFGDATTTRFIIKEDTGNVGIGTIAPGYKMHVEGDVYANGWLRSNGATGWYNQTYGGGWNMTDGTWIRAYGNKSVYVAPPATLRTDGLLQVGAGGSVLNVASSSNFAYRTNVLFANAAGNVGIGNTAPGAKLQVNPSLGAEGIRVVSASDWSPLNIRNSTDTADIFRVDQTGSLAVGSIPWGRLTSFPAACPANQYVTAIGGTLTCSTPAGGVGGTGTANYLAKWTSGTAVGNSVLYDNGTNIGIGTAAPGGRLDVKSTGVSSYPLRVTASDNGPMGYFFEDAGQHTIFDLFNGTGMNNIRLNTNGNSWITNNKFGIGTNNPLAKLHTVGDSYIEGGGLGFVPASGTSPSNVIYRGGTNFTILRNYNSSSTVMQVWSPPGALGSANAKEATLALVRGDEPNQEYIDMYNNGYSTETQFGIRVQKRGTGTYRDFVFDQYDGTTKTPLMMLKASGNVGIGTNNPGYKLDVNGTVNATAVLNPTYAP